MEAFNPFNHEPFRIWTYEHMATCDIWRGVPRHGHSMISDKEIHGLEGDPPPPIQRTSLTSRYQGIIIFSHLCNIVLFFEICNPQKYFKIGQLYIFNRKKRILLMVSFLSYLMYNLSEWHRGTPTVPPVDTVNVPPKIRKIQKIRVFEDFWGNFFLINYIGFSLKYVCPKSSTDFSIEKIELVHKFLIFHFLVIFHPQSLKVSLRNSFYTTR